MNAFEKMFRKAEKVNNTIDRMVEHGQAHTAQEASDLLQSREERHRHIGTHLLSQEKSWRLEPGDQESPRDMSPFAQKREADITAQARLELEKLLEQNPNLCQSHDEYLQKLQEIRNDIKYFPVLFISAPHIEAGVSGSFPGEPTPLMYALTTIERHLRIDEFPSYKTPDIKAILNPAVYDEAFEADLKSYVTRYKPRVVGISNMSEGHANALKIAATIKRLAPETIIIMGGAHEDGTNPQAYFRKYSDLDEDTRTRLKETQTLAQKGEATLVDFVVSGDAPHLLMKLMTLIADNPNASIPEIKRIVTAQQSQFKEIAGYGDLFFYDDESDELRDIPISGTPLNRNKLPFIFRARLAHENRYAIFENKKTAQVMACIGCPESCPYCVESTGGKLYGPKIQQRNPNNVIKELDLLAEQGYKAIFFDDSTFMQNQKVTGKLLELMAERKNRDSSYLEWGCQTTMRSIQPDRHPELLQKMAKAGCTYIYLGLEQAQPDTTRTRKATGFDNWENAFKSVCKAAHNAGIRIGCSLQFGLNEQPDQWEKTCRLVKDMYDQGYIARNAVAININTPYPETVQWIELAKSGKLPEYRAPLHRHPRFETAHQLSSLSWETADEIYALAKSILGDALVGVNFSNPEIQSHIERYRHQFDNDFYVDGNTYQKYLDREMSGIHFNSASIAAPCVAAQEAAEQVFEKEQAGTLTSQEKQDIVSHARERAAKLVGFTDTRGVVLARNTTEAASLVYWLAGLEKGDHVVLTNAENMSIQRLFEMHLDHGNPKRDDGWSAWPTWYAKRGQKYSDFLPDKTGVDTTVIEALASDDKRIEQEIRDHIKAETKVFVFSHVLRDSGKEMDVKKMCQLAREVKAEKNPDDPDIFILVDGAQALGNVAKVDFDELGCDAYIATPHKTMMSEVVGLLYFNPDNPKIQKNLKQIHRLYYRDEQIILGDMFDPQTGITPNVDDSLSPADLAGFSAAIEELKKRGLEGNDFSQIAEARANIRDYFISRVTEALTDVVFPAIDHPTSFIVNFRIPYHNGRDVAQKLSDKGMFVSFINREPDNPSLQYFRVSFQPNNTKEEVDAFVRTLKEILTSETFPTSPEDDST